MNQSQLRSSPYVEKARQAIFSQRGLLMSIRRTAWWLFCHELERKDPETGQPYTPVKALQNVLGWMEEQAEFLERVKQEPTQAQRRMLQMLVDGRTKKQISYDLKVSYDFVLQNIFRLRKKLGNRTEPEIIAIAVKKGWVKVRSFDEPKRKPL